VLLDAIAQYLEGQGLGTVGTDIFKGIMPDSPDFCSAIFEYGGSSPVRAMAANAGSMLAENPSFQVCTRSNRMGSNNAYPTARNKVEALYTALDGYSGNLSGTSYYWIEAVSSPAYLTTDENGRYLFVCNFDALKARG
jgi:hypothetical protein